ncbi:ABC transporter substrate-binding protein [Rhabdothermincola sediminis]|uniref:ABC transporter substrate-binding protein n=1 Tax=Rhabdothermincola sediminis TaxID=2751370 RepID=UPI001AA0663F|nr:ABC transporter substrate-binding protein [Rhabdothermincola sediminis]
MGTDRRARRAVPAALVLALLLGVAACGGGSTDGTTTATAGPGADVTLPSEGPPRSGGNLRFALASESDGWNPTVNRWAGDGTEVGLTIFDPLAAYDAEGMAVPYLAEAFVPNADFTEWTIRLRPGVRFHNGQPLDAGAVIRAIEGHQQSPLTRNAIAPVSGVSAPDPLTVVVTMREPWSSFPVVLTGQAGAVPAPTQLDDPDSSRHPVGTGPFRFVSWTPDKELVVERNPDYWRRDEAGQPLPYLDRIVFRPITDDSQRVNALETGDVDMIWTSAATSVKRLRDLASQGRIQLVEQHGQTEVSFVMLNLAAPPFDDIHARRAVATATDARSWVDVIAEGVTQPAYTLFRPGSRWYSDIRLPAFDLESARAEVAAYQEATGQPLSFTLSVGATSTARQQGEFLKAAWEQVGMRVDIKQVEASTYILDGVLGNYQAILWAQFGSPDPDYEQVWWLSETSAPVGSISLNFPRHEDPATDAALARARSTQDVDERKAAYEEVQRRFAEDIPYVWLDYSQPVVGASTSVRGITNGPLPDGQPSWPMGGPGSFSMVTRLTQTWLTG